MYILANTVQQKDHDGRISPSNKDWAKSIPIQKNPDAWGGDRNSPKNGIILLVIAFLVSPMGVPMFAVWILSALQGISHFFKSI